MCVLWASNVKGEWASLLLALCLISAASKTSRSKGRKGLLMGTALLEPWMRWKESKKLSRDSRFTKVTGVMKIVRLTL